MKSCLPKHKILQGIKNTIPMLELSCGIYFTEKCRETDYIAARAALMYLIREKTTLSLTQIGSFFGKDHASVLHHINKHEYNVNDNGHFGKVYRHCLNVFEPILNRAIGFSARADVLILLGYNLGRIESTRTRLSR